MGTNKRQRLSISLIYVTAVALVSTLLVTIISAPAKATYSVETEIQSTDINLVSIPEIWLQIWNDVSSYNEDDSDRYGGSTTFCDSKNMLPMQNETNDVDNSALVFFTNLSPMYCGNSQYVWRCTISGPELSGTTANVYTTTCNTPSQEELDNGTAMTAAYYSQLQEDAGITDDDLVLDEDEGSSEGSSEDTCESNFWGFGWIFCPGQNLITELINGMVGWIADSMKWTILADDSATNTAGLTIRQVWQNFLNIANVVFVIAFLIMIYSMATSTGLSNYDVKKMLPRLIVVAIAVNLSFYICAALVDLSNIIGAGLYNLIYGQTVSEEWDVVMGLTDEAISSFGSIVVVVLALFLFGGTAIIGIAIILLLIMFRQIALMALVIISPVAFAMYMLPNTQKWADKWKDMFVRLLIVYPMFTAVWGAAHLAADTLQGATGLIPGFIVSLICAVAPVVAIVPLFKMSGGLMAMAAGAISGSALARGSQKWINSKTRNNPASRLAARGVSKVSGGIATGTSRLSKIPFARTRPIRRGAQGISNKTGQFGNSLNTIDDQLDAQSVERGKTANLGLTSAQVAEIARTGSYTNARGKSILVDSYQRRAAMDQVGDGMSYSDVESMLVNTANEASQLEAQGRTREAAALRESAYKAAKASGNTLVSSGSLQDFRNGSGNWGNGNAQTAYDNAVSNYAGGLSVDQASKLSSKKHEHLQSKVSGSNATSYQNTIGDAMINAKAQSNMNQETRSNLSTYLAQVRQNGANSTTTTSRAATGTGPANINGNTVQTAQPTQRAATDPLSTNQRAVASAAGGGVGVTTQSNASAQTSQHTGGVSSDNGYQGKHFRQNTSGATPTSNTIPSANNNPPIQGTPPQRP